MAENDPKTTTIHEMTRPVEEDCDSQLAQQLSLLSETERKHVLMVLHRDGDLRRHEERRLKELQKQIDQQEGPSVPIDQHSPLGQFCCFLCSRLFYPIIDKRLLCRGCHYFVCHGCATYEHHTGSWLCSQCQKQWYFHATSLEWYYKVLKNRFKQPSSVNVSTILSQHHSTGLHHDHVPGSSSLCKPKRIQAGERTMEDWSKAMRMAGEVIQETLEKGDYDRESQEKKIELQFLKEHRLEMTEELATTIYQQIANEKHHSQEARVVVSGRRRLSMPSTAVEEIEHSSQGTCFLNSFLGYNCHIQDSVPSSFSHACSIHQQDESVQVFPYHATVQPDMEEEEEEEEEEVEEEEEFYKRLDALTGEWSEESEDSDEGSGQELGHQASIQQKTVQLIDRTCHHDDLSNQMDHEKQTVHLFKETEKDHPDTGTPSELGDENGT